MSTFRGSLRTGLRDRPPGLGVLTAKLRAGAAVQREMRSRASKAGHEVRRARETGKLVDLLGEEIERGIVDQAWAALSDRQRALVDAWLEQDRARERSAQK